jgi:hypothetical protein
MRMTGGAGGQQRATQPGRGRGQGVDRLVQMAVGRGATDPVIDGQLVQPGAVEEPATEPGLSTMTRNSLFASTHC